MAEAIQLLLVHTVLVALLQGAAASGRLVWRHAHSSCHQTATLIFSARNDSPCQAARFGDLFVGLPPSKRSLNFRQMWAAAEQQVGSCVCVWLSLELGLAKGAHVPRCFVPCRPSGGSLLSKARTSCTDHPCNHWTASAPFSQDASKVRRLVALALQPRPAGTAASSMVSGAGWAR